MTRKQILALIWQLGAAYGRENFLREEAEICSGIEEEQIHYKNSLALKAIADDCGLDTDADGPDQQTQAVLSEYCDLSGDECVLFENALVRDIRDRKPELKKWLA